MYKTPMIKHNTDQIRIRCGANTFGAMRFLAYCSSHSESLLVDMSINKSEPRKHMTYRLANV